MSLVLIPLLLKFAPWIVMVLGVLGAFFGYGAKKKAEGKAEEKAKQERESAALEKEAAVVHQTNENLSDAELDRILTDPGELSDGKSR